MKPLIDRLIVVGTGFMGASLAAACKQGVAGQVIGVDASQALIAKSMGWIDQAAPSLQAIADTSSAANAAGNSAANPSANIKSPSTAIVVATPVRAMASVFAEIEAFTAKHPVAWVTDLGSTKAAVVSAAQDQLKNTAPFFVSSHPMAGSEKHGAAAANAQLFQGAKVLISPVQESSEDTVSAVESFWIALGAVPCNMPIEDHDALVATISHLPHALAFSLASAIAQSPLAGAAQSLHGGGLRDTTRIAASSAELWADIFLDNRDSLLQAWAHFAVHEQALKEALLKSDRGMLIDLLDQAAQWRRSF